MKNPIHIHLKFIFSAVCYCGDEIPETQDLLIKDRMMKEIYQEVLGQAMIRVEDSIEVNELCALIASFYRFNQKIRTEFETNEDQSYQPNPVMLLVLRTPELNWNVVGLFGAREHDRTQAILDAFYCSMKDNYSNWSKDLEFMEWIPKDGPSAYREAERMYETISEYDNLCTAAPVA